MNAPETIEVPEVKQRTQYAPGWYKDLSNEEYHGSAGYSSSKLKMLIEQTPAHLKHSFGVQTEPTENMLLGTAAHALVLEPEKFATEFAVSEKFDGRTNAGKAGKAAFEASNFGKTIITQATFDKAQAMADSVLTHPIASLLVSDVIAESSVYWWYKSMDADDDSKYKTMVKVRPDALCRAYPVIVDLKTTVDGSYTGFIKSIQNFYYHVSAAMYLEGCNQCKPLLEEMGRMAFNKFVFVCVENTAPYLTSVYELSPEYLEIGKLLYRRALRTLREGHEADWPGYPDEVRVIEPPGWAQRGYVV